MEGVHGRSWCARSCRDVFVKMVGDVSRVRRACRSFAEGGAGRGKGCVTHGETHEWFL